jgi:hypothetical protein
MRSFGTWVIGVLVFAASAGTAAADPLPVHTATTRLSQTNLQPVDRLALADAVSTVFVEAGFRDVVPATETRNRLQDVGPVGLSCDAPECAQTVWNPLHARGLVLVHQSRTRTRVQFDIQYLNLRGEVLAHESRDEAITSWNEAIAYARAAATTLAIGLPAELRGGPSPGDAGVPPPDAAVPPGDAGVPAADGGNQIIVVRDPPIVPVVQYNRRLWEVGVGAGLVAGGLVLSGISLYNLGVHGTEVSDGATRTIEQRCALGASVQNTAQGTVCEGIGPVTPILLGVGIAALGGGIFMIIDGLRMRPEVVTNPTPNGRPRAWQFGASPLARGGGFFTLSGDF